MTVQAIYLSKNAYMIINMFIIRLGDSMVSSVIWKKMHEDAQLHDSEVWIKNSPVVFQIAR
jgi:hypothetical protein